MEEAYECYFHGAASGGRAPMVVGCVLVLEGEILDKRSGAVSYQGTSERAQWEALVQAMLLASQHNAKRVVFKGDSRSVVNYMNGQPPGRDFDAMDYYKLARKTQLRFNQSFFQWVPADKNMLAIVEARSALEP